MRHLTAITIALTLLLTATLQAVEIDTPATSEAFKLIRCNPKLAEGETKPDSCVWWVVGPGSTEVEVVQLGDGIVWTAAPGKYLVLLAAGASGNTSRATASVTIDSPDPTPGPGPTPDTLTDTVAKLSTSLDKTEKTAVANNYATVAAQIAAGALRDIDAVNSATKAANRQAIPEPSEEWQTFFGELGKMLSTRHEAGKLESLDDHAKAWGEIAGGLRR